ncbi:MAG: TetR/AcrR family transcriptional regulator [Gammaproteobacteria bacterium]|nr:MAG: TetR/AcrR family transcriptional regulator [Gammaproteobacteria bacterium]
MAEQPQPGAGEKRGNHRGEGRRRAILNALHDCIIEQGYARTTLADIARKAGMSPSHLLYYFDGKDAILSDYFQRVGNRIVARMQSFLSEPPSRQIELLSDLFFAGKGITRFEIGFMLECFGVAVHDTRLHGEKAELDRACKACLRELFRAAPSRERARDCAEIGYALLIGLRTAAFFDRELGPLKARELFRNEMYSLAGLAPDGSDACTAAGN